MSRNCMGIAVAAFACLWLQGVVASEHPATAWAREEFARWTKDICGESVPAQFLLPGETEAFKDDFAALAGTDGYAVRRLNGRLCFVADCPKGHVNGVFRFLQKNTDVIWPRPAGELAVFSKTPFVAFRFIDYRDVPAFEQRFFGSRLGSEEVTLWRARNAASGCTNIRPYRNKNGELTNAGKVAERVGCLGAYRNCWGGAHNMVGYWFPHREHADHPEYYMLYGGKRAEKDNCNLCETNPDMVAAFCRSVEEKARSVPAWVDEICILMEDTGATCQCESCTRPIRMADGALLKPADPAFKSTRFFLFFNQVARHMAKVRPGTVLRQYAYVHLSVPPKCPVEPNIKLEWCPYPRNMKESIVKGPSNANWKERLDGWLSATKNIYYREYYFCGCIVYPRPIADTIAVDLRYIRDAGVRDAYTDAGVYVDDEKSSAPGYRNLQPCCDFFTMCGPEAWATMQLMWDPDQDPHELRHEYLRRTYRAAGPAMIRFYDILRASWYADPMASGWSDSAWRSAAHYIVKKGHADACRAALEDAAAKADDPRSANEVRRVRDVFETWVAAAPKYMTEEIRIPLLRGEPGFDLDAGVWQKAARFPLVRKQGGKVTADDSGTRARMFSDGTAFWVGFEVKKDPKKIVCHTGQGVEAFPSGDEMEFLFSSDKDGYYQFAFDTRLNRYDAAVYDKSWNGDWKPMVKLTDDGWIAVVQFPFKTLGFEPIRINRVRFLPFANEWQGSPHANIHHIWGSGSTAAPEGWGELVVDIE